MTTTLQSELDTPLHVGGRTLASRLIVGTGKYQTYELMQQSLDASGADVITVAVRRERLVNEQGESLLDYIDTGRYTILPNTAGCFTAEDAVRSTRSTTPARTGSSSRCSMTRRRCCPTRSARSRRRPSW